MFLLTIEKAKITFDTKENAMQYLINNSYKYTVKTNGKKHPFQDRLQGNVTIVKESKNKYYPNKNRKYRFSIEKVNQHTEQITNEFLNYRDRNLLLK